MLIVPHRWGGYAVYPSREAHEADVIERTSSGLNRPMRRFLGIGPTREAALADAMRDQQPKVLPVSCNC